MKLMKKAGLAAVILTIVSVGSVAVPASAATEDKTEPQPSDAASAPMSVTGYDEAVAEANGFKIVTYDDGSIEAVAVTDAAKRLNVDTGIMHPTTGTGDGTAARGTVYGNCGNSWVDAWDSGRYVPVETGYNVTAPVYNRISWTVYYTNWSYGGNSVGWPGGQSTPSSWTGYSGAIYPSASDGFVMAAGSIQLITGMICSSGNPTDAF